MSVAGMLVSMPYALCSFEWSGRPVMPGIMGVAILVVPASRAAPSWTFSSFVVTDWFTWHPPVVGATLGCFSGLHRYLRALSCGLDFVSGDGRICSSDGFSDAFSDGMAASGAVLAVSFTGVHENPEECGGESRAHEVLKHLLLRVQSPVVVQRQVLQSRQCSTAWTGQLMVAMSSLGFFLGPCAQAHGLGSCPQEHGSQNLVHLCGVIDRDLFLQSVTTTTTTATTTTTTTPTTTTWWCSCFSELPRVHFADGGVGVLLRTLLRSRALFSPSKRMILTMAWSRLQQKNMRFFNDQAWFRMRLQVSVSESFDCVSLIFLLPSHLAHLLIRDFMVSHLVSALALSLALLPMFSAFASVLGARSTCRALPASVVPCLCANPTATTWQGPTWRKGSKGGVSGPAEDLRSVSEVEGGVNFRPAGGVRGKVAGSLPRRQPGAGTRQRRVGVDTPSLHLEFLGIHFVSPGHGLDIRQSVGWTKVFETARSGISVLKGNARACMLPPNLDHLRVEWMKQGAYKTAWVTLGHDCPVFIQYGHGAAVRPQN